MASISKMRPIKAPGPTGKAAEMLKAAPDICSMHIADLTNAIVSAGKIPSEWHDSYIISLFKGQGDALERGNYRSPKLIEHVLKFVDRII